MASKKVEDFFKNKVTVRLKNGHQFKGLLNKVDKSLISFKRRNYRSGRIIIKPFLSCKKDNLNR